MLKNIEDISPTKKRLRIEIPSEAIEKEIESALNGLKQKVKLPGFRQGKAPVALIEKKFGKDVEAEALEKLISVTYSSAIKEAGITPITRPLIEESAEFKRKEPLGMTITVEIRPEIKDLNYSGVKVKEIPVDVTDQDVEDTLKRLQEEKAVYEPSESELGAGDVAVIDMKSGETNVTGQIVRVGDEYFPAELSSALTGMKKGGSKTIESALPEGFHVKELAGKSGVEVAIKEVKKAKLPAIDDDLAKDMGFEGIGPLKDHVRKKLLSGRQETAKRILKADVLKKIIEQTSFDAPESLVERELEQLSASAKSQGAGADEEAMKKELRPMAERNVKASILIDIIGEKEGVSVAEEDLKSELISLSGRLRLSPENVMKYFITRDGSLDGLRHQVFEEKVLNLLYGKAIIEKGDAAASVA